MNLKGGVLVTNPIPVEYEMDKEVIDKAINEASQQKKLNIEAHMLYPETKNTFWSLVIGLGYPTPEPPGFKREERE